MKRLMAILFAAILSFALVLMPTFLEARGGYGGHGGGGHGESAPDQTNNSARGDEHYLGPPHESAKQLPNHSLEPSACAPAQLCVTDFNR